MAGNTGNKGGQYDNNNAEKWTEEEALKLGNDLIKWLRGKASNIYYGRYLHIENDYDADILMDMARKFSSFSELKKRMDSIQETKLTEIGMVRNAAMPIFVLKNKYGYSDRQKIESTNTNVDKHIDLNKLSIEQLKQLEAIHKTQEG